MFIRSLLLIGFLSVSSTAFAAVNVDGRWRARLKPVRSSCPANITSTIAGTTKYRLRINESRLGMNVYVNGFYTFGSRKGRGIRTVNSTINPFGPGTMYIDNVFTRVKRKTMRMTQIVSFDTPSYVCSFVLNGTARKRR